MIYEHSFYRKFLYKFMYIYKFGRSQPPNGINNNSIVKNEACLTRGWLRFPNLVLFNSV
jgi:hypothetical protein